MAMDLEAAQRRRKMMRRVNVPMRAVLGLPFPTPLGRSLMLLHYTGRKTGKAYRQPLSYVRNGDVLLTPGGGRWTLNLAAGEPRPPAAAVADSRPLAWRAEERAL